jgi:short-subunit dehydrogenase
VKTNVVVTGASTGIGRSLAEAWGERGARVVLVARRRSLLDEVARAVRARGGEPVVVEADVTSGVDRERIAASATAEGRALDVLVNNAGRGLYGAVDSLDPEALRALLELNLVAPIDLTKRMLPALEQAGGTVVFVSSVAGVISVPRTGAYAASKFALEAIAMALRAELEGKGSRVRVLVARPGPTDTPFPEVAPSTDGGGTSRPSGMRGMSAEKVARAIVRGVDRGAPIVTPGIGNRIATLGQRVSPAAVRYGLARLARRR